ncbi:MAG: hypothetical protein KKF68_00555 [Nanoarchaeota archaeon]|nr:hypothetical protein [Nanoarchaeota archaeon]
MISDKYQTTSDEREKRVVRLLEQGMYLQARKVADQLLVNGVPRTDLNYACHQAVVRIAWENPKKGEEIVGIFDSYHWEGWLTFLQRGKV